jgi:hypothetical protein
VKKLFVWQSQNLVLVNLTHFKKKKGSDVANIKTTAKKSKCGKYYIVNGEK